MSWSSKKFVHLLFCVFQTKLNKAVKIFRRLPEWIKNVLMIPGFSTRLGWEGGWKSCMANSKDWRSKNVNAIELNWSYLCQSEYWIYYPQTIHRCLWNLLTCFSFSITSFPWKTRQVSSANRSKFDLTAWDMSFTYMTRKSPRMDTCGTPQVILGRSDNSFLNLL